MQSWKQSFANFEEVWRSAVDRRRICTDAFRNKVARWQLHDFSSSSRSSANYIISCYNNDAAPYRWRSAAIKRSVRRYVRKQIKDIPASSVFATLCKKLFKLRAATALKKIHLWYIERVETSVYTISRISRAFFFILRWKSLSKLLVAIIPQLATKHLRILCNGKMISADIYVFLKKKEIVKD